MLHPIVNMNDVKAFIEQIADEIDNFHPLVEFQNYVYPDSYMRRYNDEEAEIRNKLLEKCFDVSAGQMDDFFTYLLRIFERVSAGMKKQDLELVQEYGISILY